MCYSIQDTSDPGSVGREVDGSSLDIFLIESVERLESRNYQILIDKIYREVSGVSTFIMKMISNIEKCLNQSNKSLNQLLNILTVIFGSLSTFSENKQKCVIIKIARFKRSM